MKRKSIIFIKLGLIITMLLLAGGFATGSLSAEVASQVYLPLMLNNIPGGSEPVIIIPAGEFQMGCDLAHNGGYGCPASEEPLHPVSLDAYQIDTHEVTNAQYATFLNTRASNDCRGYECVDLDDVDTHITYSGSQYEVTSGYAEHPVIEVTWYGAVTYCEAHAKRLPTEAEWEKVARGESDTRAYPWGDQSPDCTYANFAHLSICVGDTAPVGSYPAGASPYGALDMAGNVWEWVNDWYASDYYASSPYSNPAGPDTGIFKVARGGSYTFVGENLRVAHRSLYHPANSENTLGFRCVTPGE